MARKDALLRLTSRLIARRDALRKALNGDLDSFRKFSELTVVGDNVDAAVCGGKISEARLNALPYTNSCIDCQRENERSGQSSMLEHDPKRWAKIYEKSLEEGDSDSPINLSDFEMDFSESR